MTLAALIEEIDKAIGSGAQPDGWPTSYTIHDTEWRTIREALTRYEEALQSIENNNCCSPCREAALVAMRALAESHPLKNKCDHVGYSFEQHGRRCHKCGEELVSFGD